MNFDIISKTIPADVAPSYYHQDEDGTKWYWCTETQLWEKV